MPRPCDVDLVVIRVRGGKESQPNTSRPTQRRKDWPAKAGEHGSRSDVLMIRAGGIANMTFNIKTMPDPKKTLLLMHLLRVGRSLWAGRKAGRFITKYHKHPC